MNGGHIRMGVSPLFSVYFLFVLLCVPFNSPVLPFVSSLFSVIPKLYNSPCHTTASIPYSTMC